MNRSSVSTRPLAPCVQRHKTSISFTCLRVHFRQFWSSGSDAAGHPEWNISTKRCESFNLAKIFTIQCGDKGDELMIMAPELWNVPFFSQTDRLLFNWQSLWSSSCHVSGVCLQSVIRLFVVVYCFNMLDFYDSWKIKALCSGLLRGKVFCSFYCHTRELINQKNFK